MPTDYRTLVRKDASYGNENVGIFPWRKWTRQPLETYNQFVFVSLVLFGSLDNEQAVFQLELL